MHDASRQSKSDAELLAARRPRVLAVSFLFPNEVSPNHGIFVLNRLKALSRYADITVINPIPWSPLHRLLGKYQHNSQIPYKTQRDGLTIFHPRYLSIPKVLKGVEIDTYRKAVVNVLANDLKHNYFDLIDLHWTFPDLPTGEYLSQILARPMLLTLRGMEVFHEQDGDIRQRVVARLLPGASQVISLSQELKQKSLALGSNAENNHVIRNGVDTDSFYYIEQREARRRLGINDDEKFILMVGALIKRKGFDLVIDRLAELRRTFPGLKLRIVGSQGHEGDFRSQLQACIATNKLQDAVIFQGPVNNQQLKHWYNAADVFCLASRGEGSPNVLTEALACGCPAVASDVGAVSDIMDSEAGLGALVSSEDSLAIEKGLTEVLSQCYDRQALAAAMAKYNWDWCARSVMTIYNAALKMCEVTP